MKLGDRFVDAGLIIEVAEGNPCFDCFYFTELMCTSPFFCCKGDFVYKHVADCLGDKEHWIVDYAISNL